MSTELLRFLLLCFAGWANRQQRDVIEYLREENRVLREQLRGKRLRLTDGQRRRLAARGKLLGRRALREIGSLVMPDTILRWHRNLVAQKYDGSRRRVLGIPRVVARVAARPRVLHRSRHGNNLPAVKEPVLPPRTVLIE